MEVAISAVVFLGVVILVLGLVCWRNRSHMVVLERLEEYTRPMEKASLPLELSRPLKERAWNLVLPFVSRLSSKMIPRDKKEACAARLIAAGNPLGLKAESFLALKYIFLFLALLVGGLSRKPLLLVLLFLVALFMPDLLLQAYERKQKETIIRNLPDMLDLLCVSVEAGLSFDAALQKVVEKSTGPLSQEMEKTLQEINIGKPRREALRDLAQRLRVEEVTTFLGAVIQADQLGISMANVLRLQSQQVRASRRMKAEEKAQQAPVKILIPLLLFIFPTLLVVLLGPAVIQLIDTLK